MRSIEGLYILNFSEETLSLDDRVVREMESLESEAKLQLCYTPLDTVNSDEHFKIVYNNCRSLHKHFPDVAVEQNIISSHVMGFAETRLMQKDENCVYTIHGYQLIRNDQNQNQQTVRPPHGLALYVRDDVIISKCKCCSTNKFECVVLETLHQLTQMQIVMIYNSPGHSLQNLTSMLQNELAEHVDPQNPLVIMGDFNIDVSQKECGLEKFIAEEFHCYQLMHEPTTDQGSTLDLVFTNCTGSVGTVETYWSDHKLVYFYTQVFLNRTVCWLFPDTELFSL